MCIRDSTWAGRPSQTDTKVGMKPCTDCVVHLCFHSAFLFVGRRGFAPGSVCSTDSTSAGRPSCSDTTACQDEMETTRADTCGNMRMTCQSSSFAPCFRLHVLRSRPIIVVSEICGNTRATCQSSSFTR